MPFATTSIHIGYRDAVQAMALGPALFPAMPEAPGELL
jgi:hypothetical protein